MQKVQEPLYGIKIMKVDGRAMLMKDNEGAIFCSPNKVLLRNYFDAYSVSDKFAKSYDLVEITPLMPIKIHDLTQVLASADISDLLLEKK